MPPPIPLPMDFERAALSWVTGAGSSGHWRVVASATAWSQAEGVIRQHVLAPQVLAGDVYGAGRLPLDPPYTFQVLASAQDHTILREALSEGTVSDNSAINSSVFEKLTIRDVRTTWRPLDMNDIVACVDHVWPLSARIRARVDYGPDWLLDFPVQHFNTMHVGPTPAFQVETGPILVPNTLIENEKDSPVEDFKLAYVFFNKTNVVDLMLWSYDQGRIRTRRTFSQFKRLENVIVEIYGMALPRPEGFAV